jgi:hypothetical protein
VTRCRPVRNSRRFPFRPFSFMDPQRRQRRTPSGLVRTRSAGQRSVEAGLFRISSIHMHVTRSRRRPGCESSLGRPAGPVSPPKLDLFAKAAQAYRWPEISNPLVRVVSHATPHLALVYITTEDSGPESVGGSVVACEANPMRPVWPAISCAPSTTRQLSALAAATSARQPVNANAVDPPAIR